MSVRVIARIRPLLKLELDKDVIVQAANSGVEDVGSPTVIKIPNPKNESELYSFQFNSVYDQNTTQQTLFENEVSPTVKHLFNGSDATIFAYGVTGTGKTHTMRGGKALAERGVIPRLLSAIYRRSRKIEKDTSGRTQVEVSMSYYEIYCDKVYDLFEPPEKRTPAGLPIRDNGGKSVVVGLTERPCTTLKEFEMLYDQANVNRSTSATKLNAHSSRSHAILCVKVTQTTGDSVRTSMVSAIDLAGSEDNRRTDNNKDRMVESSSINKSLFVLAQCVEAISKKQTRIPYRESKMTRILSLGQNNGLTIMFLNLAPVRSYHLDTLSSLNFANRTKKIEVKEVENQMTSGSAQPRPTVGTGPSFQRQPLRALTTTSHNVHLGEATKKNDKPVKAFAVFTDKSKITKPAVVSNQSRKTEVHKRPLDSSSSLATRPAKIFRQTDQMIPAGFTHASIEELIERKVEEKLAAKALSDAQPVQVQSISEEVQRRLDSLEDRIGKKEDERSEGLQYLLMAKQHQVRGEDASALKMYQLALPYFPSNEKLAQKMLALQKRIQEKRGGRPSSSPGRANEAHSKQMSLPKPRSNEDESYVEEHEEIDDDGFAEEGSRLRHQPRKSAKSKLAIFCDDNEDFSSRVEQTPRTQHLLRIINSKDISQIKLLKGVGPKKAEAIVNCLCSVDDADDGPVIGSLEQLGALKGVGVKTVENMRSGLAVS